MPLEGSTASRISQYAGIQRTEETRLRVLLEEFDANPPPVTDKGDLFATLMSGDCRGRLGLGIDTRWRQKIMYLLATAQYVPFWKLCELAGTSAQLVWHKRQADHSLAAAVKAYQAAWYEREAEDPMTTLPPSIVVFGLKARSNWKDSSDTSLTQDQLRGLIDGIVSDIQNLDLPSEKVEQLNAAFNVRLSRLFGTD